MTVVEGGGGLHRRKPTEPGVKYVGRQWMEDYARWYRSTFKTEPPRVEMELNPETGNPVFRVAMGYTSHNRPIGLLLEALREIKKRIPRETYYSVRISDAKDLLKLDYLSDEMEVMTHGTMFMKDNRLSVCVEGGPGGEWNERAGWVMANVLGDISFLEGIDLPAAQTKWNKLMKTIPYSQKTK